MALLIRILPTLLLALSINFGNYMYILAGTAVALTAFTARFRAGIFFSLAALFWSGGVALINWPFYSNLGYLIFYPFLFIAIPRLFQMDRESDFVNLIDAAILVLGISTLTAGLVINPDQSFFQIMFLIADLIILIWTFTCAVRRPLTLNSALITLGISTFTATDFLFLNNIASYKLGSWLDYGWLLGFLLIAEAQYRRGISATPFTAFHPIYIGLSVILAITVLSIITIQPGKLSGYLILPAILTLLTGFTRMMIALKKSESLASELELARIDDLTGLPNRRRFVAELANFNNGSVLLLDIDGFKPVNDQYGHEAGDQLLRQISSRFRKAIPDDALIARLGGDEFGVLTNENYEAALELGMALHATLSYPFNIEGRQISVGVSIGCVVNDGNSDLMRRADTAMYQAKRSGIGVWGEAN